MNIRMKNAVRIGCSMVGYLFGSSIAGIVEEHWFNQPLRGKIVNKGLDAWFLSRTNPMDKWVGLITPLLSYTVVGIGSSPTTSDMTQLENQVGSQSSLNFRISFGRHGTKYDRDAGIITLRYTMALPDYSNNITEIGIFAQTYIEDVMFARFVLPTPLTPPPSGQIMCAIFEFTVKVPYLQEATFDDLKIDGWNVPGIMRLATLFPNDKNFNSNQHSGIISGISNNGSGLETAVFSVGSLQQPPFFQVRNNLLDPVTPMFYHFPSVNLTLGCKAAGNFPPLGEWDTLNLTGADLINAVEALPYEAGSFEGGIRWILNPNWPRPEPVSYSYFNINGLGIKLNTPVVKQPDEKVTIDYSVRVEAE